MVCTAPANHPHQEPIDPWDNMSTMIDHSQCSSRLDSFAGSSYIFIP
ncbi:hypothetical protein SUS17_680 [Sphingomonas sp. S17]|nr:hypothetical protein SUS17_680 [Sphingomonas sp. S17]